MITWDDVIAIAPALDTLTSEQQAAILTHVELRVSPAKWGKLVALGQTYLAAHLGMLLQRAGEATGGQTVGPVVSETVGPVSRTFSVLSTFAAATSGDGAYTSTDWGQQYLELRNSLPTRFGLVI